MVDGAALFTGRRAKGSVGSTTGVVGMFEFAVLSGVGGVLVSATKLSLFDSEFLSGWDGEGRIAGGVTLLNAAEGGWMEPFEALVVAVRVTVGSEIDDDDDLTAGAEDDEGSVEDVSNSAGFVRDLAWTLVMSLARSQYES